MCAGSASTPGAMTLGPNLGLGNLPFPAALMQAAAARGGQLNGMPNLPFSMQPTLGLPGHLGGILNQRVPPAAGSLPRQEAPEIILDGTKETERYLGKGGRDSRAKRPRSSSATGESDDDIMVLSNSPSSNNDHSTQRDLGNKAQPGLWENPSALNSISGLGFPLPNPALYPADPSSFIAAMGQQMPFDVNMHASAPTVSLKCHNVLCFFILVWFDAWCHG